MTTVGAAVPSRGKPAWPDARAAPRRIITVEQYERIHEALVDDRMRLLVETNIESGLRWGELTELRVKDVDFATGIVTVSRVKVELKARTRPVHRVRHLLPLRSSMAGSLYVAVATSRTTPLVATGDGQRA